MTHPIHQIAEVLSAYGRGGDTKLAHITAREVRILKFFGGAGTKNPHTGLVEFNGGGGAAGDEGGGGGGGRGRAGGVGTPGVGGGFGGGRAASGPGRGPSQRGRIGSRISDRQARDIASRLSKKSATKARNIRESRRVVEGFLKAVGVFAAPVGAALLATKAIQELTGEMGKPPGPVSDKGKGAGERAARLLTTPSRTETLLGANGSLAPSTAPSTVLAADEAANKLRATERRRRGRRSTILSKISREKAQLATVARPAGRSAKILFGS